MSEFFVVHEPHAWMIYRDIIILQEQGAQEQLHEYRERTGVRSDSTTIENVSKQTIIFFVCAL